MAGRLVAKSRLQIAIQAFPGPGLTRYGRLVRRLCELCGAKLYAADTECRQCGTPAPPVDPAAGADAADSGQLSVDAADSGQLSVDAADSGQVSVDAADSGQVSVEAADSGQVSVEAADSGQVSVDAADSGQVSVDAADSGQVSVDAADAGAGAVVMGGDASGELAAPDVEIPETDSVTPPPMDVPPLHSLSDFDDTPRRGPGAALAVVALLAVGGAVAAWVVWPSGAGPTEAEPAGDPVAEALVAPGDPKPAPQVEPRDGCEQLEPLAGDWEFTTEVVTASNPAQLGIRGFYGVSVEVDGCAATASVRKTGYTGRWYTDKKIQRGTAPLEPAPFFGFVGAFDLRDEHGRGGKQEFVLSVHDNRLTGMYRTPGRSGFLEGARDPGRRILPSLHEQPCVAQCAVACDLPHRANADAAAAEALQKCETTCALGETPRCGDTQPLPDALVPEVTGPAVSLAGACSAEGGAPCRVDVKAGEHLAPSLSGRRLDGDWRGAQYAAAGAAVFVGLRTAAGWFSAGPILDRGSAELTAARVFTRDLSSRTQYVVGDLSGADAAATFACRLDGGAPRCAVVPGGSGVVHPLPGNLIAVTAQTADLSPGVYSW